MNLEEKLPPPGHERTDANPRVIGLLVAVIFGLVGLALLAGRVMVRGDGNPLSNAAYVSGFRDGPAETLGISRDREAEARTVDAHLRGYGWTDRSSGFAHVPIERAIDLTLAATGAATTPGKP